MSKRPTFPERATPSAYAQWEYDEAPYQMELMEAAGVNLAGQRVLDVGCGLGGKSVAFAERGMPVVGVDLSLERGGLLVAVFGPFGSPLGSHLYDRIFVPWCHVLFSRDTLAETLRELARRRGSCLDRAGADGEMQRAEEQIAYFDHHLNRMTLRRFRQLLRDQPGMVVRRWMKWTPPKLRPLTPLLRLPGLDELLTGLLVVVAERTD